MDKIALLKRLLDPKKIAVIGASKSKEKVGGIVFRRLMDSRRRLFPVNPKESAIDGYKVSPDILALPRDIDLAVITVSAEKAVESVEQCIERGIPNYIIVAGGFGEVGAEGRGLEDRLKQLAKIHHINILGPNSLGIFLPDENIDTIFVEHGDKALDRKGKVACIVQSGSAGVEALGYASNTGYGMRAFVGLGNKCDLDEVDFLYYFSQDEKTNCLGFYLENIKKGREFLTAARKTAREKPVVVLKAGMTHTAASAVSSHTGKLAGSDNVISGALKQFGIQRVYDDEEFCDATKVLSMLSGAPGNRVAVLTAAGGYGVMCTDFIEKKDARATLEMAKLSDDTKKRIKTATFPFTACENRMHWLESLGNKNPDEFDAKQLVSLYSIKVPQGRRLLPSDTLNTNDVNPPCVLKVCSSGILHKTDVQGVILNNDRECITNNLAILRHRFPNENILVENQAGFMGPEFIVGIIRDPVLGHAVMVGAGGVLTEIYNDTAFRLAPCSIIDATDMIDELVLAPVFNNFRGLTLDKHKLALAISHISQLAHDLGDRLNQLDINPIVFSKGEWIALDVKVVLEPNNCKVPACA